MEITWTSIARWLVHAGVGGSFLIVVTLLAMRWVRQPARRQRLGELGLVSALVLACLCWGPAWLPLWEPAPAPSPVNHVLVPVEALDPRAAPAALERPTAEPIRAPRTTALLDEAGQPGFALMDWLLPGAILAYAVGAAFYLTRWLAGVVALWRIVRAAQPATPALCLDLQRRFAKGRRPRLLISSRLRVPVSCGLWRPTVILPEAMSAPEQSAQRDWVFAHEATHLARRDAWSGLLFAVGQMLYFVLPWFWWLRRVVRLCQEYVADAAAVQQRPADEYAEFLLSLTTSPAAPLAATGVRGPTSDLYRRVSMILQNPVRVEQSCPRGWTIGAAGVLLGLAVLAAGVGPAQADPPNQKEVLEQLSRIQDMVNKLRDQLATQAKEDAKKAEAPKPADAAVRQGILYLQRVDEEAGARARDALKEAAAKQATEATRSALASIALAQQAAQRDRKELDLEAIIELLKKHQADLKDEKARQQMQEAIDRLKDALKQQGAKGGKVAGTPRVVTVPYVPATELRKVWTPDGKPLIVGGDKTVRLWDAQDGKPIQALVASPSQGRLGLRVDAPSELLAEQLNLPKDQGLVVTEVMDNSVAKKAGIKVNDVLLKINNQPVSNQPEALVKVVGDIKADTPFDIVVLRRGKQETIQNVRLAEAAVRYRYTRIAPAQTQVTITAQRSGTKLTLQRNEGALMIAVQAEVADGKSKVTSIGITEKGKTSKHAKVEEVPEAHRAKVQHLLQLLETIQTRDTPQRSGACSSADRNFFLLLDDQPLRIEVPAPQEEGELGFTLPPRATEPGLPVINERNYDLRVRVQPPQNVEKKSSPNP